MPDVDEEIKAHTAEELVVLLAIGPKGCSWEKLRHKVRIIAPAFRLLFDWEFIDFAIEGKEISEDTLWGILSLAKNRTLWVKKRKYCVTTEFGARVYQRLLEKISEKNAVLSKFIDCLHGMDVSALRLLADWFAKAKTVEFSDIGEFDELVVAAGEKMVRFVIDGDLGLKYEADRGVAE
jgi:hypothetical protein